MCKRKVLSLSVVLLSISFGFFPKANSASLFFEDFEGAVGGWTPTGFWHLVDTGSPYPEAFSPTRSFWYGQDTTGDYDLVNPTPLYIVKFQPDGTANASSEGDQYVMIRNPGSTPVVLNDGSFPFFKVGDASSAIAAEGMYDFPDDFGSPLIVPPLACFVIAKNSPAYEARFGIKADAEFAVGGDDPLVPNMVLDPGWGSGSFDLNHATTNGDEIILMDMSYAIIDQVAYGTTNPNHAAIGLLPPTLVTPIEGNGLARLCCFDTNDMTLDFGLEAPANPTLCGSSPGSVANSGSLVSPVYAIPGGAGSPVYLEFRSWSDHENISPYDAMWVQISVNGIPAVIPFNPMVEMRGDLMNTWIHHQIDLSAYGAGPGDNVQFEFYFDTGDATANNYRGWYIDDLEITDVPATPTPSPTPGLPFYLYSPPPSDPPTSHLLATPIPPGPVDFVGAPNLCGPIALGDWTSEPLAISAIPAGDWRFHFFGWDDSGFNSIRYYVEVYEYSGVVPGAPLLFSFSPMMISSTPGSLHDWIEPAGPIPFTPGNQLFVRIYADDFTCLAIGNSYLEFGGVTSLSYIDIPPPPPFFTPTYTPTISPTETSTFTFTKSNSVTGTFSQTLTNTLTHTPTYTSTWTPTWTSTNTPTWTTTYSPTWTSTDTPSWTPTWTSTSTWTPTWSPTDTSTYTQSNTATWTPTWTSTHTPTHSSTWTPTWTPTYTPTWTPTFTSTYTQSNTATWTPTWTSTHTPTHSSTWTPTWTPTHTPTWTPTATSTFTQSNTLTWTPTWTGTSTFTYTPTHSVSFTPTYTFTDTSTYTPTHTPMDTMTATPTWTPTFTPPATSTWTPTFTSTVTITVSPTITPTWTPPFTRTHTGTITVSPTISPTWTPPFTRTSSPTPSMTPTKTLTFTTSPTYTVTPTPRLPLQLSANFFNPTTQNLDIGGLAEASGPMTVDVFNIAAEKVRHIADWNATAGIPYRFTWNGRNDAGEFLGNGVYVIMMKSTKGVTLKKVIILK